MTGVDRERSSQVSLIVHTTVLAGQNDRFSQWERRIAAAAAEAPGFVDQHVEPPVESGRCDWVIVQNFETREHALTWLGSDVRAALLDEIADAVDGEPSVAVVDDVETANTEPATQLIRTRVHPGLEDEFREWFRRIDTLQAASPGYLGSTLQEPVPGAQDEWVTILAFDSQRHLDAWTNSPGRLRLMKEAEGLMDEREVFSVGSGFGGWFRFRSGAGQQAGQIPMWKLNLLILLGLYPIVLLEILILNPLLEWMNIAFSNFIGNAISVGLLGWPVVTLLSHAFRGWVEPGSDAPRHNELRGGLVWGLVMAIVVGIGYALAVTIDVTPVTEL